MADSFSKKENFKKKQQKKKEKAMRREERKTQNNKGKSLDEMLTYVDAFGRLSTTPPEKGEEVNFEDIQLGAAVIEEEELRKIGVITFFSDKGYGFITESGTNENIFFHSNNAREVLKKGNKVSYEKERSPKGFSAVEIKIEK